MFSVSGEGVILSAAKNPENFRVKNAVYFRADTVWILRRIAVANSSE